jgi:hypothetical protein
MEKIKREEKKHEEEEGGRKKKIIEKSRCSSFSAPKKSRSFAHYILEHPSCCGLGVVPGLSIFVLLSAPIFSFFE